MANNTKTISKFNNYLLNFINELNNIYPDIKENTKIYNNLENNNSTFLLSFRENIYNYLDLIINNDNSIIYKPLFKNIDLSNYNISEKTSHTILKYINVLYVQAFRYDKDINIINNIFKKIYDKNDKSVKAFVIIINNLKKNKNSLDNNEEKKENNSNSSDNPLDPTGLLNGSIGKLAMDIAKDVDLSKINLSDPGSLLKNMLSGNMEDSGLQNLFSNITTKITNKINSGEIDTSNMLSEAQNIMSNKSNMFSSMFKNMPGMANMQMPDMSNMQMPDMSNMQMPDMANMQMPDMSNMSNDILKNLVNNPMFKSNLEKEIGNIESNETNNSNNDIIEKEVNNKDINEIKNNLLKKLSNTQKKYIKKKMKKLSKNLKK